MFFVAIPILFEKLPFCILETYRAGLLLHPLKGKLICLFFSVEILEGIFRGHKGGRGIFCVPQNASWDWNIYIYHKSNPNVGKYTAKTRVLPGGTFNAKQKHVAVVRILGLVEVDRLSCLGVGSLTELPLKH